jgi:hypothetical protein
MPTKTDVEKLNRLTEGTFDTKLGEKLDLLLQYLHLLNKGSGLVNAVTLGNSTVSLSFTAFNAVVNGVSIYKASGTQALTATTHDVAIDKWASYRVSVNVAGTVTITKQAAAEDNTEAAAIANLAALPADTAALGYFTVRGGTGAIFDATTNNLQTGAVAGMVVNFYPATPLLPAVVPQLL